MKAQKRAIILNLIHSLDACVIAELCNNLRQDMVDLYTVHGCFAVTANNIQNLMNNLKSVYLKLDSSNYYLTFFDNMLKININKTYVNKTYKINDSYIYLPHKDTVKKNTFSRYNFYY